MKQHILDTSSLSDLELISFYSKIVKALKVRKIIRTKNIIGEIGEKIAVESYKRNKNLPNLKLALTSTPGYDALSSNNKRYAIKTITGRTTGVFYGLPSVGSRKRMNKIFDYLIIVKLNEDYEVIKILELDWKLFLKYKKWHKTMRAWNISLSEDLISNSKVIYK